MNVDPSLRKHQTTAQMCKLFYFEAGTLGLLYSPNISTKGYQ